MPYPGRDSPRVSEKSLGSEALQADIDEHPDDDVEEEEDALAPQHPESPEQLSEDGGLHDSVEEAPPQDATPEDDVEDSDGLLEDLHRLSPHQ